MKTTVVGVFPRADDARRVLSQLVASTLDLDAIRVFHKDPDVQRDLAAEAGLTADRTVPAGIVAGAFVGAAVGFGWGLSPDLPLAQAGPLFLAALGLLLGGAAGGVVSAMTDSLPVPREQLPELEGEVEGGASVVLVRTDSLPTARAIRDLFQAGGSEVLEPVPGADSDWVEEVATPAAALAGETAATMAEGEPEDAPDHHAPFVPPWRRLWGGGKSSQAEPPAPGAEAAGPAAAVATAADGEPAILPGGLEETSAVVEGPAAAAVADAAAAVAPAEELGADGGSPDPRPAEGPVAPWERPAPAHAEPAQYEPPQMADVAEDAAPRRRGRKADAEVEPAPEPDPPQS